MATDTTVDDLWTALGRPLRRFVDRRVGDRHAAEDIVQDVMLKVLTRAAGDDLPAPAKLAPWVLAIARNAVVDHYRRRQRRDAQVTLDQVEPMVEEADGADLAQAVGNAAPCIRAMVARLPRPYAEALRLADLEGLDQAALAERTGLPISGAKSRVQRGRRLLRGMVLDCCHVETDGRGRVLKPGGRLAVSDIALKQPLPKEIGTDLMAYVGCVAGAIQIEEYRRWLGEAGLKDVAVIDTGKDLNAYSLVEGQSGCCAPSPTSASSSCCSTAPTQAGSGCCGGEKKAVHDGLAELLRRYNVNDYAASVQVYATKRA